MIKMKLNTLVRFLNRELNISNIKDDSRNGLQVRGKEDIRKVGVAVDACMDVFKKAKIAGCDAIIVHHGVLWKGRQHKKEATKTRIAYLKKNRISLLAYHLPLDQNRKYGNNALLFRMLGARITKKFYFGFEGEFEKPKNVKALVGKIDNELDTESVALLFGKKRVKRIGVISGSWKEGVNNAITKGFDLYLTGQTQYRYNEVKEANMNLIFAGHYSTETLGAKEIGRLLERRFGLKTTFIENPVPI